MGLFLYLCHMRFFSIILSAVCLFLTGCGHPDSFRVDGVIEGNPTMNLRVVYSGPGGVQSSVTASREGKFHFEGHSDRPTIVQVFDNEYRVIGRTIAANGEDLHLRLDRENPYNITAEGDALAARWATWLRERADSLHAATPAERNAIIGGYIKSNPGDPVGGLLLLTDYDSSGSNASGAAELWASLEEEAKPGQLAAGYVAMLDRVTSASAGGQIVPVPYMVSGGKTELFRPAAARLNLIAVTGMSEGHDSVAGMLSRAGRHRSKGRFEVVELSLVPDTMEWRRSVYNDSVKWTQGWIAGGISAGAVGRLGIPSLPYFIVADSAGTQLWRGSAAEEALSAAVEKLSTL